MKYLSLNLTIDAKNEEEIKKLLLEFINIGIGDISYHCTSHDPSIPYMSATLHEYEEPNLNDCTDGCNEEKNL